MMPRKARCVNFGNCRRADGREELVTDEVGELLCPEPSCGRPLRDADPAAGRARSAWRLLGVVLASALVVAALLGLMWRRAKQPDDGCAVTELAHDEIARMRSHVKQGMTYGAQRMAQNARAEFEQALRIAPHRPGLRNNVGAALLQIQDLAAAGKLFEEELALIACYRQAGSQRWDALVAVLDATDAAGVAGRLDSIEAYTRYNLACVHARRGRSDEALNELERAVQKGFDDVGQLRKDPDLAKLRKVKRFRRLIESLA